MRRLVLLAIALAPLALSIARAAESPYTKVAFDKLLASGQPTAVVLHADWCPTCRAQAPVLRELAGSPEFHDLTILVADFDQEKALRQALNISQQSTIVTFRNGREVARGTGTTDRAGIQLLLRTALNPAKH